MLSYLVDRLPLMVCPKWVMSKSQPIAVHDVVTYLIAVIEIKETAGRTFDIGGTEIMTYVDMMKDYAKLTGKSVRIVILPFLTPRLSSYWIDLVTPIKASLARPLIDSLKHEAIVENDEIRKLVSIKLKSFDEAIMQSKSDEKKAKTSQVGNILPRRFSPSLGITLFSLIAVAVLSAAKLQAGEVPTWLLPLEFLWYLAIPASVFFLLKGARLGSLLAGIIFWLGLGFMALEIFLFPGSSLYTDIFLTVEGGVFIAGIISSHVIFHAMDDAP